MDEDKLKEFSKNQFVQAYIDGACSGNPGVGGWGVYLEQNGIVVEKSGGEKQTTNNRMEMMSAVEALKITEGYKIIIHTDSSYLRDGITKWIHNWKLNRWQTSNKTPVKNQDLWQIIDNFVTSRPQDHVTWKWVRGHSGVFGNERADALARKGVIACRMDSVL